MAATYSWNAANGSGDWVTNASDWTIIGTSGSGYPQGAGQSVFLTEAGSYTVTIGSGDQVVLAGKSFVDINDGNAILAVSSGGQLGVKSITLAAGEIQLTGSAVLQADTASVSGLIEGIGTIGANAAGGTWTFGTGGTVEAAGGTLDFGYPFNAGSITINSGNFLIASGAVLELDANAAFSNTAPATVSFAGAGNAGTLIINATTLSEALADYFSTSGTINTFNGTLASMAAGNLGSVSVIDLYQAGSAGVSGSIIGGGTIIQVIDNSTTYDFATTTNFSGYSVDTTPDGNVGVLVWLAQNDTWTNTSGGDWDTASNWSSGTLPGVAGNQTYINQAGSYAVTFNGNNDSAVSISGSTSSLLINDSGATLSITGGTKGTGITGAGSFDLVSGKVALSGTGASLLWNSSTIASTVTLGGTGAIFGGNIGTLTGTVTLGGTGSTVEWNAGTIDGRIKGAGTIAAYASAGTWTFGTGGTAEASGGTLDVGTASNGDLLTINNGVFVIDSGATLKLDRYGAFGNAATISFGTALPGETLAISTTTPTDYFTVSGTTLTFNGTLLSMPLGGPGTGGIIDLLNAGTSGSVSILNTDTLQIVDGGTTYRILDYENLTGDTAHTQSDGAGGLLVWVCYAKGTHIITETGEVPVEDITEGTRVVTLVDGAAVPQPVTWVGQRRINLAAQPRPELGAPVRIRRGAFGANLPHRDLVVSPDHGLFIDGKLIPAKLLINDMTIVQERDTRSVTYYHIELQRHAILCAEGVPAESYLDTGNRAFFSNAGLALMLHPEFTVNAGLKCWTSDACAPLAVSAALVEPVWRSLAERAETLGYERPLYGTTDEPDLRLVADGRRLRPLSHDARRYVFGLPAGVASLRLTSRASVPSHMLAYLDDWRRLGVAIRRIRFHGGDGMIELPPDHPGLTRGWYDVERDDATMWRWMNGNAVVPLPAMDGPMMAEVEVGIVMTHLVEDAGETTRPPQARRATA